MSEAAKIILIGHSSKELLSQMEKIKLWDSGHNYPIIAVAGNKEVYDSIENIENAIKTNLSDYIEKNFANKDLILKSGGNDELYLVDNPDSINSEGEYKKLRSKMTHLRPKKKKRK